jgi:hypothetical protein
MTMREMNETMSLYMQKKNIKYVCSSTLMVIKQQNRVEQPNFFSFKLLYKYKKKNFFRSLLAKNK